MYSPPEAELKIFVHFKTLNTKTENKINGERKVVFSKSKLKLKFSLLLRNWSLNS